MRPPGRAVLAALAVVPLSVGCMLDLSPTSSPPPTPTPSPSPSAVPSVATTATATVSPTITPSPTPAPEPPFSLPLPDTTDARVVDVTVTPSVDAERGTLRLVVTSGASERIDELVLRWPTALDQALFVAPFTPSDDRIRDGGPPLVQPWTKWVVGPGERGEPEATTSLGWGPLLPGATLTIDLVATRRAPGAVAFDLQLLAGNDVLTLSDGRPAELRVEVP